MQKIYIMHIVQHWRDNMSKILVITPIYKIDGRKELMKDSEAVHYLVKYWKKNNEVYVINAYINGLRHLFRYLNPKQLKYYFTGYNYTSDNVPVTLIERQNIFANQQNGLKINKLKYKKLIYKNLNSCGFVPEKIVVHIPSTSKFFVEDLDFKCEKIAVLHYTDVKYLKKHKRRFIDYLSKNFSRIYCRSKNIYHIFAKEKLNNLQEQVISSGVNISKHRLDTKTIFNNKKIQVLYVGKLIQRKNLDMLISSLSKITDVDWNLDVIGTGPMKVNYEKLVNNLNLTNQVHFLGACSHDKIFEYMKKADIFCMPSIKETFGLVYLEAMSQGCITIGTKNEGIDGIIIDGNNGFLINPTQDDLVLMIKKIIKLTSEEKQKIVNNAIETAEEYEEEKMSKKYYNIIMEDKQ